MKITPRSVLFDIKNIFCLLGKHKMKKEKLIFVLMLILILGCATFEQLQGVGQPIASLQNTNHTQIPIPSHSPISYLTKSTRTYIPINTLEKILPGGPCKTLYGPMSESECTCYKTLHNTKDVIIISPGSDDLQFNISNNSDFDITLSKVGLYWCEDPPLVSSGCDIVLRSLPKLEAIFLEDEQIECSPEILDTQLDSYLWGCNNLVSDIGERTIQSGDTKYLQLITSTNTVPNNFGSLVVINFHVFSVCENYSTFRIRQNPNPSLLIPISCASISLSPGSDGRSYRVTNNNSSPIILTRISLTWPDDVNGA